uniref:Putative ovule protein n=1 Tax=Solanum chacoense TaxID=4108 RepID=A0A0V0HFX1_SOLCH
MCLARIDNKRKGRPPLELLCETIIIIQCKLEMCLGRIDNKRKGRNHLLELINKLLCNENLTCDLDYYLSQK